MRISALVWVALTVNIWASQAAPADRGSIAVCLEEGSDYRVRGMAEPLASKLFAEIRLRMVWHRDDRRCLDQKDAILIRVFYESNFDDHPRAFGYALPYGGRRRIVVFYDRVERVAGPTWAPRLLAYVLAHEITHVLQVSNRHAETGIMKAVWNYDDIDAIHREDLHFTPMDVFLIDRGLDRP